MVCKLKHLICLIVDRRYIVDRRDIVEKRLYRYYCRLPYGIGRICGWFLIRDHIKSPEQS